jgi:hypothetical protein
MYGYIRNVTTFLRNYNHTNIHLLGRYKLLHYNKQIDNATLSHIVITVFHACLHMVFFFFNFTIMDGIINPMLTHREDTALYNVHNHYNVVLIP